MGPREGILGRGNGLGKPDELSTAGSWFSRPEDPQKTAASEERVTLECWWDQMLTFARCRKLFP